MTLCDFLPMMLEDRTQQPQMAEDFKIKIKELRMVLQWFWSRSYLTR